MVAGRHVLVGAIVLVVAAVIFGAFVTLGPPSEERARRIDGRRIGALSQLSSSVRQYHRRHTLLPAAIEERAREPGVQLESRDPVSGEPYAYRAIDDASYELCAQFDRPSEDGALELWTHGAGRQCFTLEVDAK